MTTVVTTERAYDRGTRRGAGHLRTLGEEFREKRLAVGVSQQIVARGAALSQSWYSEVEAGTAIAFTIVDAARVASVLGLDLSVRVYPGGSPLRDAAHSERLMRFLKHVRTPLSYRLEVPLPALPDRPEQRAWDAMILGGGKRSAIELEMRLRDGQALERRINLKRRDDPTEGFVLLVADTRTNRRILAERPDLFDDLPRLRPSRVHAALVSGQHPPSGILLV